MMSFLLLAFLLTQTPAPRPQTEITLAVRCSPKPNEVTLTISNSSDADTAVVLGYALANGGRYLPRELIVEIKRDINSEFEALLFLGPAGIAGRMDHWIVTLPARADFNLPLRATDFAATAAGFRPLVGPPEELRVRLVGRSITSDLSLDMAGMKLWRVWEGTAVSNSLRVLTDCAR